MTVRKTLRIAIMSILTIIAIVLLNTFCYVLIGQQRSTEKLSNGLDLNLYECCSIYATHLTMCFAGYPIAPEAAKECLCLHFIDRDTVYFNRHNFSKSEKLKQAQRNLKDKPDGSSVRISWNANKDYSPFSGEHRLAIATNPCTLTKVGYKDYEHFGHECLYRIAASTEYPIHYLAEFDFKKFKIVINEGLFRYLQDRGWLHKYTAVYNLTTES